MERPLKDKSLTRSEPHFSQPVRQVVLLLIVTALVGAGGYLAYAQITSIFASKPLLNGLIIAVFFLGVLTCFWQMVSLARSVSWIEGFAADVPGHEHTEPPQLLVPLAALLRSRGRAGHISTSSAQSILESVATRIEESRDITRYLSSLLIFLGLLGTFYGLATTVPAVVDTIRALAPSDGEGGVQVFGRLMEGLETQLGGMGTAFSSSLLGLAGSLVVGLMELFAGHGQNRFYRELEEWLSSITRLSFAGGDGESGLDQAALVGLFDTLAEQSDLLHAIHGQAEASRQMLDARLAELSEAITALASASAPGDAMERLAGAEAAAAEGLGAIGRGQADAAAALGALVQGQDQMTRFLAAIAQRRDGSGSMEPDAESRMRLRSIDVQMLRLLEEVSAGRQESMAELRAELSALTRAVRNLRPEAVPPSPLRRG